MLSEEKANQKVLRRQQETGKTCWNKDMQESRFITLSRNRLREYILEELQCITRQNQDCIVSRTQQSQIMRLPFS